ncbi:hypothetical protein ACFZAV_45670 [Streptomyces sp. NPDC008343]|uniref:hypothetical protein n=1 Tax=Streptomyces sp. NPDC008343 TaxID=3364828 RepID=UPI0036EC3C4B
MASTWVPTSPMQPGDLIFYGPGRDFDVGVYDGRDMIYRGPIHSFQTVSAERVDRDGSPEISKIIRTVP